MYRHMNTFVPSGSCSVKDGLLDLNGHTLTVDSLFGTGGAIVLSKARPSAAGRAAAAVIMPCA